MTGPVEQVESGLADGSLRHDGNPVLRWCVANVAILQDTNGNRRPDRKRSKDKIDGAVATIMGIGRMVRDESGESVYARRGVVRI